MLTTGAAQLIAARDLIDACKEDWYPEVREPWRDRWAARSPELAAVLCPASLSLVVLLGATSPAGAQGPQAITIDSNLTVKVRPYSPILKVLPFASVVLLTGGNGVLNLNAAGDIRDSQGNFLIRSARRFLNARLNVAMLDAEPAFAAPNGLTNQRLTPGARRSPGPGDRGRAH